jgi:hypothetical protein
MEKRNLINGYYLLEHDLKKILSFIEPTQDNFKTYSHQLYALFIRACMEFEAGCKMILIENKYKFEKKKNPTIHIYYEIHNFSNYKSINTYLVRLHMSEDIDLKPLESWKEDKGPDWYQAYNDVKHSRVLNFSKANLLNVLNAVAAVFILLYARYDIAALNQHQENSSWETDDDGFTYKENSLFKIKPA